MSLNGSTDLEDRPLPIGPAAPSPQHVPLSAANTPGTVNQRSAWLHGLAILVIPFSYSYLIAATNGLVAVWHQAYGPRFWVYVNACFLLPGLPCAGVQLMYDISWDLQFGSFPTFAVRMIVYFVCLAAAAVTLIVDRSRTATLGALVVVGFVTWMAHGTASHIAQLFPTHAMILLQTGMQMAGVAVFLLVLALPVSTAPLQSNDVSMFYGVALFVVLAGGVICLIFLASNQRVLQMRDENIRPTVVDASVSLVPAATFEPSPEHATAVRHCVITVFVVVTCTNVMGCLFTYIKSTGELPSNIQISTALVYCRLLSDAISRPVIHLWTPAFARSPRRLMNCSLFRACLLGVFFMYQQELWFQGDWFIMAFVSLYSFSSGTLVVCSYVATQELCSLVKEEFRELALTQSTSKMNVSFNAAGFCSVFLSMLISHVIEISYAN